jgi:hypothetical protein
MALAGRLIMVGIVITLFLVVLQAVLLPGVANSLIDSLFDVPL